MGQHFETLLLLYWSLASFASTVALLPVPGAAGFRCGGERWLHGAAMPQATVSQANAACGLVHQSTLSTSACSFFRLPLCWRMPAYFADSPFHAVLVPILLHFAPPARLPKHRAAVRLSACRGKLLEDAPPHALGPLSNWTVPQRWFGHFYALGSACNVAVAFLLLGSPFYASLAPCQQATAALALALLQLHLGRRLAETQGLMRYPPGSRMHGVAYLFGMRCGRSFCFALQRVVGLVCTTVFCVSFLKVPSTRQAC